MPIYEKKMLRGRQGYRYRWSENGVHYEVSALTVAELERKIFKKKKELEEGDCITSPNVTLRTWAREWLEVYKKPAVVAKSYATYKSNIENHIIPALGSCKLTDILPIQLQAFLNKQAAQYSRSHTGHVKDALTGMFRDAAANNIIKSNPAAGLRNNSNKQGTRRPITADEEKYLLKVCEYHYMGLWPLLMLYCGLRPQECSALLVSDVNLEARLISVTKAVDERGLPKNTKTTSGNRSVPIPEVFIPRLRKETEGKRPDEYVILSRQGKVCTTRYLENCWKNIKRNMNIEMGAEIKNNRIVNNLVAVDFVPYCLRHTYCTNLQRAGVPINVAKYLMGHKDIKMVAHVYGHQTDDQTAAALNLINQYNKSTSNI